MVEEPKSDLRFYLQRARDAVLWKLEGLSEYDVRRPLVPSGTNLLGLVKHLAAVEAGYLGATFHRPFPEPMPWVTSTDDAADMWATADESRDDTTGLYRRACAHGDATVETLDLEALGEVPWWPQERNPVSLHQILVHLIAESHRHAGHADIVRELIDGGTGVASTFSNMPEGDAAWWDAHRARVEQAARDASGA